MNSLVLPIGDLLKQLSFTVTPICLALTNNPTQTSENPFASKNSADFDVKLDGVSGFTQDDIAFLGASFGMGGPHSRLWQWYAGTIDTSLDNFLGYPVYRRIVDEGRGTLSLIFPTENFGTKPWYQVVPGNVTAKHPMASASPNQTPVWEGIGTGWYYAPAGGGAQFRPDGGERVLVAYDNTETTPADGPVPTVFNGDFEQGVRQSLWAYFTTKESATGSAFKESKS